MPATDDRVTTIEELLALPEDGMLHELLEGVHVVTPAPTYRHQSVLARLYDALRSVDAARSKLIVLWSPADIRFGSQTLVQPDLFVLRRPESGQISHWREAGTPLVIIETLSPSTAAQDRGVKREICQRVGVAEYWIVDIDSKIIERWTPKDDRPEICSEKLTCSIAGNPVEIDVQQIFG